MNFKCKCGNDKDFSVIIKDSQKGLYCNDCGKWIKWLSKEDINLCKIKGYKFIED